MTIAFPASKKKRYKYIGNIRKKHMESKLIRYSFRFNKRVTSVGIKSYIIALYLTLYNVKKNEHIFMRQVIKNILIDIDSRKTNKGLSEAVCVKLMEQLLEKDDTRIFYRHMEKLLRTEP